MNAFLILFVQCAMEHWLKRSQNHSRRKYVHHERAFSMKKTIAKRLSNFALALAVVFCAAAMLPSKASAKVNGTGSSSSNHITWKGQTLWGYATRGEKSGTAKTTFTATAGLTAHVKLEFNIPSGGATANATTDRKETDSGTTVTAIVYCPDYGIAKFAYGGHDVSYGGYSPTPHLETRA